MIGISSALIIIDLQADFLCPHAPFAVDPRAATQLQTTLERLVPTFRSSGGHVIWIKSQYAPATKEWKAKVNGALMSRKFSTRTQMKDGINEKLLDAGVDQRLDWVIEGTHLGKRPCCQEGTSGAQFASWVTALIDPDDLIVTKTYYSAFKESELQARLAQKGVRRIYLAGLLSNMCVLATALYARRLAKELQTGWDVCAVIDALAWRNEKSHSRALETMRSQSISLVSHGQLIPEETDNAISWLSVQ